MCFLARPSSCHLLGHSPVAASKKPSLRSSSNAQRSPAISALRSEEWPIRLAALRILEEGAARTFGALTKDSPAEEIDQMALVWEA